MKYPFNPDDRLAQALKKSAIIFGAGLLVTLIVWQIRETAVAKEISYQQQMNYLRDQVARIRRDREWTEAYQFNYEQMVANRLIGEESRLEWRSMVVDLARNLKLPEVKITFSPKQARPVATNPVIELQAPLQVSSYSSQMTLDLRVFHALDLILLLSELDRSTSAVLMPKRCSLSLDSDPVYLDALPLVTASCDLGWVTVQPAPPKATNEYF